MLGRYSLTATLEELAAVTSAPVVKTKKRSVEIVQTEAADTELDNASDEESDYEGSDTETQ